MLKPSTSLDWYLGYLHSMLLGDSGMPMWEDIYITENISYNGGTKVDDFGELIHFKNYYERFKEITTKGWPWINLSAIGLYDSNLIISIEVPNRKPEGAIATSVNISGPSNVVAGNDYLLRK